MGPGACHCRGRSIGVASGGHAGTGKPPGKDPDAFAGMVSTPYPRGGRGWQRTVAGRLG